jgi:hypothetical protein
MFVEEIFFAKSSGVDVCPNKFGVQTIPISSIIRDQQWMHSLLTFVREVMQLQKADTVIL